MLTEGHADLAHPEAADWVLGTLTAAGSEEFQQHVAGCGHCQAAVAEFGHVGRLLQQLPPAAEPPPDLQARIIAGVEDAAAGDRTETHLPRIPAAILAAAQPASPGSAAQPASPGSAAHIPLAPPQLASYYRPSPGALRPRPVPMAAVGAPAGAAAKVSPTTPSPAGATAAQPPPRRRRVGWFASAGAMVVVIVAAIVFLPGFSGSTAGDPPGGTQAPVLIPLRPVPGTAAGGQASAQRRPGGWSIQLSVHGLKPLAPGAFYECWFAGAGNKPGHLVLISAGTFSTGRSGSASVSMWGAADPRQFRTVEITAQSPGQASQLGPVILSGVVRT